MNILIINGSHRVNGNCERFSEVARNILSNDNAVRVVNLIDMNIKYCTGCLNCEEGIECSINDDFSKIIEPELKAADLIIFATPTYFNLPSAVMINFLDRTNKLCEYFSDNAKKSMFYLVGQTDEESIREAYKCLHTYSEIMNMEEIEEPIVQVARMPESVSEETKKRLYGLFSK